MAFEPNDDLLKLLAKLGLAGADGKLLSGAYTDPVQVTSGTVQSTVYPLSTVTLPAGLLTSAKRGALVIATFTTAANANAKDITIKLGATAIATITGSTANAKHGVIIVLLLRTAANAQIAFAVAIVDNALVAITNIATATETEANALAVTLNAANTAAAAASATSKGMVVLPLG